MKQCWRWFGPADTVALDDLHQVGVEGIVTALHHFKPGTIWPVEAIVERKSLVEQASLTWDVVESLPVSETIKTQGTDYQEHLDAYRQSMRNLASCGIQTICYNFMPILDWTRTQLRAPQSHGGTAMQFRLSDFAVFDLHILQRPSAKDDYSPEQITQADAQYSQMEAAARKTLQHNIVAGLPGANDAWTVEDIKALLDTYKHIDHEKLRQHLIDFLAEVSPLAQELGIRLCCHPDDPPFGLLGLPRVMSSTADYKLVMDAVDLPANGATLCTGSLGVAPSFDPVSFVETLGSRIHFVHLRNTKRLPSNDVERPDFFEAPHLEGDTNMATTIKALMNEEKSRRAAGRGDCTIPMRPDHGQELLSDMSAHSMPGYPLIGRMRGLAELRGIMHAYDAGT